MSDESQGDKPRENKKETPAPQTTSPKKGDNNPPVNPVASTLALPLNPQPSPSNPRNASNRHKKRFNWKCCKEWLEAIGIIAGVAVLIVLCLQYREMAKTTNIAIGQLKAMQAQSVVMQGQWQSMTNQASIMQEQADEMRQNTEVDERAWVYAEIQNDNLVLDGTNYVFYVTVKNTGKTAALCTGSCLRAALDVNQIPRFDQEVMGGEAVLTPDETFRLPQTVPSLLITYTGLDPVYLYGTVFYRDIFGNKHWTQFCYAITHSGGNTALIYGHSLTDDIDKMERTNEK